MKQVKIKVPEAIITLDPGKMTGYSFWRQGILETAGGLESLEAIVKYFINFPYYFNEDIIVVYEGFARANASTGDQLEPIEMCGAIKALCIYEGFNYIKQYPSQRTGYIPFAKEMLLGIKIPQNIKPHATDAVAHGIRFIDKCTTYEWRKR